MVAKVLGPKMCRKLPKKMKEKGLTVEMEEVFREGPYVVLQMQVIHVDTAVLGTDGNESSLLSGWINLFMELVGVGYQKKIEEDYCKLHDLCEFSTDSASW
jgi:hypothetical protein